MNRAPGTKSQSWTVTCEYAADGTGDMIVPLPNDLLVAIGLTTGDKLNVEKHPDGTMTLTPIRS